MCWSVIQSRVPSAHTLAVTRSLCRQNIRTCLCVYKIHDCTGECLFNADKHIDTPTLRQKYIHMKTEAYAQTQQHKPLNFRFRPLGTLVFLFGPPNTQPTVTIATSERATVTGLFMSLQHPSEHTHTRTHACASMCFQYSPEDLTCKGKLSILPLLMIHPWIWSLKVGAEKDQWRHLINQQKDHSHNDCFCWCAFFFFFFRPGKWLSWKSAVMRGTDKCKRGTWKGSWSLLPQNIPAGYAALLPPVGYSR